MALRRGVAGPEFTLWACCPQTSFNVCEMSDKAGSKDVPRMTEFDTFFFIQNLRRDLIIPHIDVWGFCF